MAPIRNMILSCILGVILISAVDAERRGPPQRGNTGGRRPQSSRGLDNFAKYELVTDLIDNAPRKEIGVEYPFCNGKAEFGNEMVPYQVKAQPNITYSCVNSKKLYTLVMVDAGPIGDKSGGGFAHWLVGNIPGNNVTAGEDQGYAGAMPPKGDAPHRYTFLLYEQPGKVNLGNVTRWPLNVRQFQTSLNLGQPIAGNFFLAQSDAYSELAAPQ